MCVFSPSAGLRSSRCDDGQRVTRAWMDISAILQCQGRTSVVLLRNTSDSALSTVLDQPETSFLS